MKSPITADSGAMLNAYPDSMGGTLADIAALLARPELRGAFTSFYILPSLFHTDLDRGFSVIDYSLNQLLAAPEDLDALREQGIDLKLDFILNHASVLSPQFQDIIQNGENSPYKDFFINWNKFWEGHGTMTPSGYIQPDDALIQKMFFRKPGLPILMVRFPDRRDVPYWNTFYQEVRYPVLEPQELMHSLGMQYGIADAVCKLVNPALASGVIPDDIAFGALQQWKQPVVQLLESRRRYLGQMDLNIQSPLVWEFYDDTLRRLSEYGARIVRLDAFAYAPKEPGAHNFMNVPGTWDLLEKVQELANRYGLTLLPEIHASYGEKVYAQIAQKGYMTYDFFLPGLIIDALENADGHFLQIWAQEQKCDGIRSVTMLGCHDGIPLLDLKGLVPDERIQNLIDTVVSRGGFVKDLHGAKNIYYQVNATYYSALGEDDRKMLLARALHLFMPGKPQVWYLDLFAGKNDHEAVARAGAGGHKEINRPNLTMAQIEDGLQRPVVQRQLELLKWRNQFPAFGFDAQMEFLCPAPGTIQIIWRHLDHAACLEADLRTGAFSIVGKDPSGANCFTMHQ